ncbi:DMT family transporter [Oceanicola sp. S124]|uniref:DMT family transporter n=1 Tax=Oceanicola sp. S124 TaxID=1042378 RepID=UPI0002558CA8|nr:DMT family transporter [Oceanicola sp. S124]
MQNLRGIVLVILAMAFFTLEDGFNKFLTTSLPAGQVMVFLGLGGVLLFGGICLWQRSPVLGPLSRHPAVITRTVAEGFSTLFFISALALVPIATVGAVFQATPLAITLGAALFLGERVGWRRWSAIVVGFLGVLVVIRPGLSGFQPEALLVLGAVLSVAVRDLAARRMPEALPSTVAAFLAFSILAPTGVVLLAIEGRDWQPMTAHQSLLMLLSFLSMAAGYYLVLLATRIGDASAVTPFRYTRLLFTLIMGALVFAEMPDLLTYAGSALILGSGLYTFLRERRLARRILAESRADPLP